MTSPLDNLHCPGCDGSPTGCTVCREAKPTPPETPSAKREALNRCQFYSRAYGVRCELEQDHAGNCNNQGDCFAPGYDPIQVSKREAVLLAQRDAAVAERNELKRRYEVVWEDRIDQSHVIVEIANERDALKQQLAAVTAERDGHKADAARYRAVLIQHGLLQQFTLTLNPKDRGES